VPDSDPLSPDPPGAPLWRRLDAEPAAAARARLAACCGSRRWIERMLARRPFRGHEALLDAAREEWWALGPEDWREAFAHHPRIGDRQTLRTRFAATGHLSEREQAGVDAASQEVLEALAAANRAYEARFGYIFIVCAAGKSAEHMLGLLQERLRNDPALEIRIAAGEQAKITALRLGATK
jgi:2-oxo-4-hydroxy-4-carboxy-5-ureidoimidazoline decarboxylase